MDKHNGRSNTKSFDRLPVDHNKYGESVNYRRLVNDGPPSRVGDTANVTTTMIEVPMRRDVVHARDDGAVEAYQKGLMVFIVIHDGRPRSNVVSR